MTKINNVISTLFLMFCSQTVFAVPLIYEFTAEVGIVDYTDPNRVSVDPGDEILYRFIIDLNQDVLSSPDDASFDYFTASLIGLNYGDGWTILNGGGIGYNETPHPIGGCGSYGCGRLMSGAIQIFSGAQVSDWYDPNAPDGIGVVGISFIDTNIGYQTIWPSNGSITAISVASAVPEPTSIAMLGLGLAGIGFSRRKKF